MAASGTPQSGIKDKNYDLITVTQLPGVRAETRLVANDAEREGDNELADLFRTMQEHSPSSAEECKRLLRSRLQEKA